MVNGKFLRFLATQWINTKHRVFLKHHPKVFCNSFHKSGTQLLVTAVEGIPGLHHYDKGIFHHNLTKNHSNPKRNTTPGLAQSKLRTILPGEMRGGHMEFNSRLAETIEAAGIKHILTIRDPRDVIISTLTWWNIHGEIDIWPFRFFKALTTQEEKLNFLILGHHYPKVQSMNNFHLLNFPNIVERFQTFMPWLSSSNCLQVKFEDLKDNPQVTFETIYGWIWNKDKIEPSTYRKMIKNANPMNSKTFMKSETEKWPAYFNNSHLANFEKVGGNNLLKQLAYKPF